MKEISQEPLMWNGKPQGPGLRVQLSPENQAKATAAWKAHMAKPPEQKMREYAEAILNGCKMMCNAVTALQQDSNVEAVKDIIK